MTSFKLVHFMGTICCFDLCLLTYTHSGQTEMLKCSPETPEMPQPNLCEQLHVTVDEL